MIGSRTCAIFSFAVVTSSCAPVQDAREHPAALPPSPPPVEKRTEAKVETPPPVVMVAVKKEETSAAVQPAPVVVAPTIEAARAKIEASSARLKEMFALVEKVDPEDSDLKSAEDAVTALRTAIEEGSTYESKELAYAKFSLAARKDARAIGDTIKQKRLDLSVAIAKEELNAHAQRLTDAWRRTLARSAAPEDFVEATAAAEQLKETLAKHNALSLRHEKLGKLVRDAREKMNAQKLEVAKRELETSVLRQRARIEEGRKALAEAANETKKRDVVEEEFLRVEVAIKELTAIVDQGANLRDREYASYVHQVRLRLNEAAEKNDRRRTEVAVTKKKAEIDGARRELAAMVRRVNAWSVTDADFNDAKSSAALVERSFEGADAWFAKDQNFARWVADAKSGLASSKAEIDRREQVVRIEKHRAKVAVAIEATREAIADLSVLPACDQADAVVGALEKTIAEGDPKLMNEPRRFAEATRKKIRDRREDLSTEQQKVKIETQLELLKESIAALDGLSPGAAEVKAANDRLSATKQMFADAAELEKSLPKYGLYAIRAKKSVDDAAVKIEKRRIELEVRDQKARVQDAIAASTSAVELTRGLDASKEDLQRADGALAMAKTQLEKGAQLERVDRGYLDFASSTQKELDRLKGETDISRHLIALRAGPIALLISGQTLARSAAGTPEEQKKALLSAIAQLKKCQADAATILVDYPRIASTEIFIDGRKTQVKGVLGICAEAVKSAEAQLSVVRAKLDLYETAGALENARSLLAKAGKNSDQAVKQKALAQLETCVEKGRLLQYKNAELKDEELDVGGEKLTLPSVVSACHKEAKALRAGG